jgi:hypothetical protein
MVFLALFGLPTGWPKMGTNQRNEACSPTMGSVNTFQMAVFHVFGAVSFRGFQGQSPYALDGITPFTTERS